MSTFTTPAGRTPEMIAADFHGCMATINERKRRLLGTPEGNAHRAELDGFVARLRCVAKAIESVYAALVGSVDIFRAADIMAMQATPAEATPQLAVANVAVQPSTALGTAQMS